MAKCEVIDLALSDSDSVSSEGETIYTGSSGKTSLIAGPTEDGCAVTRSSYWKATVNLYFLQQFPV